MRPVDVLWGGQRWSVKGEVRGNPSPWDQPVPSSIVISPPGWCPSPSPAGDSGHGPPPKKVASRVWGPALTQRAEEADVVVGAGLALRLLLVDAPKALLGAEVHDFTHVLGQLPLGGAGLDGHGPLAHAPAVVEADGLQALVVPVPPGVVDVEPGRPLSPSTWDRATREHVAGANPLPLNAPVWPRVPPGLGKGHPGDSSWGQLGGCEGSGPKHMGFRAPGAVAWEAWGAQGGHHIPAARAPGDTTVGSWCPCCPQGKVSSSRLALGDMVPCSPFGLQGRGVPEQLQLCPQQHSVPWVPSGVASRGGSGTAPQWPYLPCPGRGLPGWGLLSRASPVRRSCPAPSRSPGTLGEAQGESPRHRLAPIPRTLTKPWTPMSRCE